MKPFDVQVLLNTAKARTGLSDFGEPSCLDNLESLVISMNAGGNISESRWDAAHEYIVRLLVNRLWFHQDLKDNPEILDQKLQPPVAVVSLPRTGSTKTQRLLGASNEFQNLLWWQMHMLARIPGEPDGGRAERIRITKEFEVWTDQVSPELKFGHARHAEAPEEEQILQEYMFQPTVSVQFSGADYTQEQLMSTQMQPIFDYMAMQLKYLQWQFEKDSSRPWLLKAPQNMSYEKELVNTFGRDMKIITTHRDPKNIIASIVKLGESFRAMFSETQTEESLHKLGKAMLMGFAYSINTHMAWRDENPDIEILDLSFHDVRSNTDDVLRKVYGYLDIELTPEIEKRVADWERESDSKHQSHKYTLEQFGLTEEEVDKAFEPYTSRFSEYVYK